MARSYEQKCFIARALDVLGERWTLLILRELTLGPRRFGELLDTLPGLGTSLLASRLKHLEKYRLVRRSDSTGPGNSRAYELDERGEELIPLLTSFAEWGAGLGQPPSEYADRTAWRVVAMRLNAPQEAVDFDRVTQLEVGDELFWLYGDGEKVQTRIGLAPVRPALRLTCGQGTFAALARGHVTVDEAVAAGELAVDGEQSDARHFFDLFTLPALAVS